MRLTVCCTGLASLDARSLLLCSVKADLAHISRDRLMPALRNQLRSPRPVRKLRRFGSQMDLRSYYR